jgi:hypothetical protein
MQQQDIVLDVNQNMIKTVRRGSKKRIKERGFIISLMYLVIEDIVCGILLVGAVWSVLD